MDIASFILTTGAVIVGLVQVVKGTGLSEQWLPLVAVVMGLGASVLARAAGAIVPPVDTYTLILSGIICGLSAVGLYSSARATAGR